MLILLNDTREGYLTRGLFCTKGMCGSNYGQITQIAPCGDQCDDDACHACLHQRLPRRSHFAFDRAESRCLHFALSPPPTRMVRLPDNGCGTFRAGQYERDLWKTAGTPSRFSSIPGTPGFSLRSRIPASLRASTNKVH
jgi:hypothetical protein